MPEKQIKASDETWHNTDDLVEVPEEDDGRHVGRCYYHWRQPIEGEEGENVYFETEGGVSVEGLRPQPYKAPDGTCNGLTSDGDPCKLSENYGRNIEEEEDTIGVEKWGFGKNGHNGYGGKAGGTA